MAEPDTASPATLAPGAGAPLVAGAPQSLLAGPPRPGLAYAYSRKNLAGIAVAVVISIAMIVSGIGGLLWPVVALAGYVATALLVPSHRQLPGLKAASGKSLDQAMEEQLRLIAGRVPGDIYGRVASIQGSIRELVPRAAALPAGSEDLYVLQRIPLDYLPEALDAYLRLPPAYARLHPVSDGKTPRQLLADQLALLDSKLGEISDDIARNDSDRLMANGRFLQERFGRSELQVPALNAAEDR